MKQSKKSFTTREQKVEFLKGLKDKTRSINEIADYPTIVLHYRDGDPEFVFNQSTGKLISREEARKIRNRAGQTVLIMVKGQPRSHAHQRCVEDQGSNPKAGPEIKFIKAKNNQNYE